MDKIVARERNYNLYDDEGKAIWLEHASRNSVDVVALPFGNEILGDGKPYCLNEIDFVTEWMPDIGTDCFVVGFPEGLTGPLLTPIWKRGSIASEPSHAHQVNPNFWIDTLGNPGLSGSPVIGQGHGILKKGGDQEFSDDSIVGSWQKFVGIYSGRTADEGVGFQLGIVWKAEILEEILQDGVQGNHPIVNGPLTSG